jgi:hypothetical protein
MVGDELRRAQEFRDTAAKLRALARQVSSHETRGHILELAERFERMAGEMDGGGAAPGGC